MVPLFLTFFIAKTVQQIVQRMGRGGGTALPGLIAYRLNRSLLPYLAQQLGGTIIVSGTNGKTTTSRLIASFLEGSGKTIVHNRSGSNLTRGILSALIAQASWKKKVSADWGLFEVDEAVFAEVVGLLKPDYILALNLFRDQLDRYGEVNTLADKWRAACQTLDSKTTLILNADDPLIASLAVGTKAQLVNYGVDGLKGQQKNHKVADYADSRRCPICGSALVFKEVNYSHLGNYHCPNGDFEHPKLDIAAKGAELLGMEGSKFRIYDGNATSHYELRLAGLYNIYNVTAALAVAYQMNLDRAMLEVRIKSFQAVFGRLERVQLPDSELVLILVKNPTGFNQVVQTLNTEPTASTFWFLLNDKFADGRDISWIWDIEMEKLREQTGQLVIGGTRAHDMALRVKYADFDLSITKIAPSLAEGLRLVSTIKQPRIYCLCTYTAMLELRQLLQRSQKVRSYHTE